MVRKSGDVNGPCVFMTLLYLASQTTGALDIFDDAELLPALLYYFLFMAHVLAIAAVCQWPALQFETLAMEVQGLSIKYPQAFDPSAVIEVRWLLTCIERQDNRYSLWGICRCDESAITTALSAVCMYFFTCFTSQGFDTAKDNNI
ncbi:uncharacterized protein LOC117649472 [Thrips palmi]|uniref:Uncharacterized protein LOC117649472 n=1 Tax=Thrips palmi TaxID=161013 RepID=A0A6P8ZSH9_THRPL|nr:uncharacterized protein LOC117649472 [Thrips palmi]